MIAVTAVLVVIAGPLLLGLAGMIHARRVSTGAIAHPDVPWGWTLMVLSALLYVVAFNLTFFIQELFLVLPKALTPGLQPTLFHNNHGWQGEHPLASLFQGTGALATLLVGIVCALLLGRDVRRSMTVGLLLFWMAYSGIFMALPQVVFGALIPGSDVGMAMNYLGLSETAKTTAALVTFAIIPAMALWLARLLLSLADSPAKIADARARTRFVFQAAVLPALIAIPLIVPFRVPREWIEVILLPVLVTLAGIPWVQAGSWCFDKAKARGIPGTGSIAYALVAALLLLLVFQLVLRPGIAFY